MPRSHGEFSKIATGEPDGNDVVEGGWPRARLIKMNLKFCERVERAIRRGSERNQRRDEPERKQ